METELLTLYNVMNSYKSSLITTLDKIDRSMLQALGTYGNTRNKLSITKKYKLSLEIVEILRNYVQMLYTGENIAEELFSKLSELDRDTQPERERRTSNPFLTESNEPRTSRFHLFKNELDDRSESAFTPENNTESEAETLVDYLTDVQSIIKNEENSEIEDFQSVDFSRESSPTPNSNKEDTRIENQVVEIVAVKEENDSSNFTPEGIQMEASVINLSSDTPQLDNEEVTPQLDNEEPPPRVDNGELPPQNCRNRVSFKIEPKKLPNLMPPKEKIVKKVRIVENGAIENKQKKSTNASRHIEKKTKEKSAIYDIVEDDLRVNEECVFCHIITPAEFYLRSNQELFEGLENSLNEELNSQSQWVVNKYKTKQEARANLGNFCFGFIQSKGKWFRIEVLDWMLDDPERIFVQLLDYGDKTYSTYNILKPMIDTYSMFPKMAIKCHLAGIYSPDPQGRWLKDSIEYFMKLSEIHRKTKFKVIYVYRENDSYGVDLAKVKSDGTPIGILLERSGYALQCSISGDYLSTLEEDDLDECDNINEAIAGYDARDEARICRFTDETGTKCFKGAMCKLEHGHLSADGITTDKVLASSQPLAELSLPSVNSYIRIFVTGYINSCNFYVHIITNPAEGSAYNQEFKNLQLTMKSNNIVQTYQPFKVLPGLAELVLVKEGSEWFRGKCRGYAENDRIEIFLVDFGSTTIKKLKDLRQMKEDFLYVPFQAVECIISDCQEKRDASRENSFHFFQSCMQSHEFSALVKDSSIPLKLKVWDVDGNDMTYVIKEYGLGQERTADFYPATKTVFICD